MTADCAKWVETNRAQFTGTWGLNGQMEVVRTSENELPHSVAVQNGVITTSDFDAADGCNIVYTEDDTVADCADNDNGQSNRKGLLF